MRQSNADSGLSQPHCTSAHDEFDGIERRRLTGLVEHGEEDAGRELQHEHTSAIEPKKYQTLKFFRRVVAGELIGDKFLHRKAACRSRRAVRLPSPGGAGGGTGAAITRLLSDWASFTR